MSVSACAPPMHSAAVPDGAGATVTFEDLRAAESRLALGPREFNIITAHVAYNNMPMAGPSAGPGLQISAHIAGPVGPDDPLTADRLWLIRGNLVWEMPIDELRPLPGATELVARGRPGWPPPAAAKMELVDLVVRLHDRAGRAYLLARRDQRVTNLF